jgi:arylsulfatase A-like enzyme
MPTVTRRPRGWGWLTALSLLNVIGATADAAAPSRPNVLIVLVDDMGYGDLGCYGGDITTPHIDGLARDSVRLTDFYANGPVCTPTRCGLMTGRYQQRVGLEWATGPGMTEPGLPTTEVTLPRLLKDAGYRTAMFGKWHLGYKPQFGPVAHGFDEYFGLLSGNHDFYSHREINGAPDLVEGDQPVEKPGYTTDLITARSVAFLERQEAGKPFFLYVAYNAVHWPFQRPDTADDVRTRETWFRGTRDDYAAMLRRVDDGVGRMLGVLAEKGLDRDTLVVFTDDNGGERLSSNAPLAHHKGTLWEGGIRVPCLLRWPGRLPAGAVSKEVAITMDLTATALSAAGATLPAGRTLDGLDLVPRLVAPAKPVARALFWRINRPERRQVAARDGRWKYLRDGGIEMLYDLEADPSERRDVQYEHPDELAHLRGAVAAWEAEMDRHPKPFVVK